MINLAEALAHEGRSVDLVVVRAEGPYLAQVQALEGVRLVPLGGRKTTTSVLALARYLRQNEPRAIISALSTPNITTIVAARLARYRGPVVVTVHNTLRISLARAGRVLKAVAPRLMRWMYPLADAVVAVSTGVADELADAIDLPRHRVHVIFNPVVSETLLERAEHSDEGRRGSEAPTFLGIGRLAHQKGFDTLIRAFAEVRKVRPAQLLILGEGPLRQELTELAESLGLTDSVSLPGFVDNPYARLARSSVFVLSSRWEGLPTVLIEALALGVPVVATDCPSGPSEILVDARSGTLVPVDDVKAMSEAMLRRMDQPHDRELGATMTAPYTFAASANGYLDLLDALDRRTEPTHA